MRTSSYLALSLQTVLQREMTVIANNLANATTTGYQAERLVFDEALARTGRRAVAFVQDVAQARDLAPGPITQTGNPLDLAIRGGGFLVAVHSSNGDKTDQARTLCLAAGATLVRTLSTVTTPRTYYLNPPPRKSSFRRSKPA